MHVGFEHQLRSEAVYDVVSSDSLTRGRSGRPTEPGFRAIHLEVLILIVVRLESSDSVAEYKVDVVCRIVDGQTVIRNHVTWRACAIPILTHGSEREMVSLGRRGG